MNEDFSVKLTGISEVADRMQMLSDEMKKRGGRAALRKAANVIVDKAKANARALNDPETNESIEANIVANFSPKMFRRTGNLMFRVGILGGARQYANTKSNVRKRRVGKTYAVGGTIAKPGGGPGGDTFYWRFLEFGTKAHKRRPARKGRRGRVTKAKRAAAAATPKKPLMIDAMHKTQALAFETFRVALDKSITRALRKQARMR